MKSYERIKKIVNSSLAVLVLCLLVNVFIYTYASSVLTDNVEESLTEIAKQGAKIIEKDIQRQLDVLKTIAKIDMIKDTRVPIERKLDFLNSYLKVDDLLRISIADSYGNSKTTDMGELYVGDREYFTKAIKGHTVVSDPIRSRVDGKLVVTFSVPIYKEENIVGVLYATYRIEELSRMTEEIKLGDDGYSFIMNGEGAMIAHKDRQLVNNLDNNFGMGTELTKYKDIEMNMIQGREGAGEYTNNGVRQYIGYAPIKETGWSIAVTIPKSKIFNNVDRLLIFLMLALILLSFSFIAMNLYNKNLKKNLQIEKRVLDSAIRTANIVIISFDKYGIVKKFNEYAEKKLGFSKEEVVNKRSIYDFLSTEGKYKLLTMVENYNDNIKSDYFEMSLETKDRNLVYILWNFSETNMNKDEIELMGIDITERVIAEKKLIASHNEISDTYEQLAASQEELKERYNELTMNKEKLLKSEERYRLIAEAAGIGIWDFDFIENESFYSNKWYEIFGIEPGENEMAAEKWESVISKEDFISMQNEIRGHLENYTDHYEYEYCFKTKDGKDRWIKAVGKALLDENRNPIRLAGSDTDITELKEYQNKLRYLAYHDTLTSLPNRAMLNEKLAEYISEEANKNCALLFIDTDNFKLINDTLGHAIGDQLIINIGDRLKLLMNENSIVFRLGGDEFIILVTDYKDIKEIENFAILIRESLENPFRIQTSVLNISVSIGISLYPLHGSTIDELLKNADIAMYKAKDMGKSRFEIFDHVMNNELNERMRIETYLRKGLENHEFILYYQPQVDIAAGRISGFEALVRWNSPEMGMVPPMKFIKIAEDSKLIIPLGEMILRNACAFIKKVHDNGFTECIIAVNISILQLMQENFVDMVLRIVREVGINLKCLELEITESILMESFDVIGKKLETLRSSGIKVALDDFGKGYSSLSYLEQLPISTLKIDKSFIDSISGSEKGETLIGAIVSIGHNMGLCVVAEGVEIKEQLDYLSINNCDKFQGYLFSKPLPEEEAFKLLGPKND